MARENVARVSAYACARRRKRETAEKKDSRETLTDGRNEGWMDGWMVGCVDAWMDAGKERERERSKKYAC